MNPQPLDETVGSLAQHWKTLAEELSRYLPQAIKPRFERMPASGQTTVLLRAANSSRAPRQRGPAMPALPMLVDIAGNPRFQVGYEEEWEERKGSRPLRFKASNLTFFMFPPDDAQPVQLFRAEWPGVREWSTRGTVGCQAPDAGHPHWQFDALNHYMSREQRFARLRRSLNLLESSDDVVDFDPLASETMAELTVEEEGIDTSWTAVHFAAGAKWPLAPWVGDGIATDSHVWVPASLKNIRSWVVSAVVYTRDELLKCCAGCRI